MLFCIKRPGWICPAGSFNRFDFLGRVNLHQNKRVYFFFFENKRSRFYLLPHSQLKCKSAPAIFFLFSRSHLILENDVLLPQPFSYFVPINYIPEFFYIIWSSVLEIKIISVFPNIAGKQWFKTVAHGISGI